MENNKEKYSNFFGDSGNYRFQAPRPNPYNLRGNPDEFDWDMDRGGDGLNGTYQSFGGQCTCGGSSSGLCTCGQEQHSQFLGKFGKTVGGWFKKNPDRVLIDSALLQDDITYSQIYDSEAEGYDPRFEDIYDLQQEGKKAKKKLWWANLGKGFNNAVTGLGTGYSATQNSAILQGPQFDPNANVGTNTETTVSQAGLGGDGSTKTIGMVLVGVVILGGIFWAVSASTPSQPGMYGPAPLPRPNTPNY